jgi:hypothetical protein
MSAWLRADKRRKRLRLGRASAPNRYTRPHRLCARDADEVVAKALDLMAPVLGTVRANELIAMVYKLDSSGPVSGLRRPLQA